MGVELEILMAYGFIVNGNQVDRLWSDYESEDMEENHVYSHSLYGRDPTDVHLFALDGTVEDIMDRKVGPGRSNSCHGKPRNGFAIACDECCPGQFSTLTDNQKYKYATLLKQIDASSIPGDLKTYVKEQGIFGKWLYAYYH